MPANPRVYLDFQIGTRAGGRVVFELFLDTTPKTAENFRGLCTGEYGQAANSKKKLEYINSKIFRVRPGFMFQGGDITLNTGDGGESIYGEPFKDESFMRRHHAAGCLSMANKGRNSNTSQFFVTFKKSVQLDGKHVVFGHVVEGMEVIRAIEKIPTDRMDRPKVDIVVVGCGEVGAAEKPSVFADPTIAQFRDKIDEMQGKKEEKPNAANIAKSVLAGDKALPGGNEEEDDEDSPQKKGKPAEIPAAAPFKNERERKLFELKLKMNGARNANNTAVVDEAKKEDDPTYRPKRQREDEKAKAKEEDEDEEDNPALRVCPEGREYLTQTAATSELVDGKKRRKNKNAETFGWEVFNQDSLMRAHEKRINQIVHQDDEYSKQRDELGETFYAQAASMIPVTHNASADAKQRLADSLDKAKTKRKDFSRRRTHYEDEDITSINDRNAVFNKKLERSFGEYTLEMRQNLERGTAL